MVNATVALVRSSAEFANKEVAALHVQFQSVDRVPIVDNVVEDSERQLAMQAEKRADLLVFTKAKGDLICSVCILNNSLYRPVESDN